LSALADGAQLLGFLGRTLGGLRRVRLRLTAVLLLSAASGLASTGLLALINAALSGRRFGDRRLGLAFATLCLLLPACRFAATAGLAGLTGDAVRNLRVRLAQSLVGLPLRRFEELGAPRAMTMLTQDVATVSAALNGLPALSMQLALVASSLVYLGFLSWRLLAMVAAFMAVGIVTYQLPGALAVRHFRAGRRHSDTLMRHFRAVCEGGKELRLHEPRRTAFFDRELAPTADAFSRSSIAGNVIFGASSSWGLVLFFILLGLIVFFLSGLPADGDGVMVGYGLVILALLVPLEAILNSLPMLSQAAVAVQAIERIGLSLDDGGAIPAPPPPAGAWRTLELSGVTHAYTRDGEAESFVLGPIDLTLEPGELLFLVGGNGSGKTTLAKLLTGLYRPESGAIRLDGQTVDEARLPWYQQHFSTVFSDFHLFAKLLGLHGPDLDGRARRELERLKLDHKVTVADGALSTLALSQGQRKRLALLTAYLEDRPIYLFDEWAADQDPFFKELFYRELLPQLKARGKTLVVISHDDRYYDLADRIVELDYGQVVADRRTAGV
jgi:putative ATP-binding cassette transporter